MGVEGLRLRLGLGEGCVGLGRMGEQVGGWAGGRAGGWADGWAGRRVGGRVGGRAGGRVGSPVPAGVFVLARHLLGRLAVLQRRARRCRLIARVGVGVGVEVGVGVGVGVGIGARVRVGVVLTEARGARRS